MAEPAFAMPLRQSPRSAVLEWPFPRPHHGWVLTGTSRAAWHTSFLIPQLNLLLDAGLCVNKLRPKHIFLTHGHSDHTLLTPAFVTRADPPDVFCPVEMAGVLDAFVDAKTMLSLGGLVGVAKNDQDDRAAPVGGKEGAVLDEVGDGDEEEEQDEDGISRTTVGRSWLRTHVTHGLRPGDTVPLRRLKGQDMTATAFACDHTVPCLGYVFHSTTQKLLPEHRSRSPAELQALRRSGLPVTAPVSRPVFAFLGDTTAATLAARPAWLEEGIPVVITECSFLHEEHRRQADKTRHTLWSELEPVVRAFPRTIFVLMHFSLRYSDAEIRRFFRGLVDPPENIVVWVDGEGG